MSHILNGDSKVWPCVLGGVATGAVLMFGLAHVWRPTCCKISTKKPSKVTLFYFDGRGLAEVARQMMAVAGVEFVDERYEITVAEGDGPVFGRLNKKRMDDDQAAGKFDCNMGRLPILEVDGVKFGGSKAIYRYIAATYGLAGSCPMESAQIDSICEMVADISEDFNKKTDDAAKAAWFDTPAAEGSKQGNRCLQYYLTKLSTCVGSDGFAVGGKCSMADAVIYSKFGESCKTAGLIGNPDSQPMGNSAKVDACLQKCAPNVLKIVQRFHNCPQMKAYLAKRAQRTQLF